MLGSIFYQPLCSVIGQDSLCTQSQIPQSKYTHNYIKTIEKKPVIPLLAVLCQPDPNFFVLTMISDHWAALRIPHVSHTLINAKQSSFRYLLLLIKKRVRYQPNRSTAQGVTLLIRSLKDLT